MTFTSKMPIYENNYFQIAWLSRLYHGRLFDSFPIDFFFNTESPECSVFFILGMGILLYSFFTKYELGVLRVISMPVHLTLDLVTGALLAASPWLFGFSDRVFLPHLILGIAAIMSKPVTEL